MFYSQPPPFSLTFFKCTLYWSSVCDKFITWRQLDRNVPRCSLSILHILRWATEDTSCFTQNKDKLCSGRHMQDPQFQQAFLPEKLPLSLFLFVCFNVVLSRSGMKVKETLFQG